MHEEKGRQVPKIRSTILVLPLASVASNTILPRSARGLLRNRRSNWLDPLSQGALLVNSVTVNSVDFTCLYAVTNII